ncbi:hypothetical protein SCALM49S_08862 [Streptomyces californicus]
MAGTPLCSPNDHIAEQRAPQRTVAPRDPAGRSDLCTERGYGHVTIEAIAAAAGVSKKTIYRWWPSKGAVLLEAFTDALVDATPFVDTGDIGADLRTHVAGAVKLLSVPPFGPAYAGILSELHHDDRLAQQLREQLVDPRVEEAIGRLRSAQDRGQIPPGADLPLAVEMLYGPVYYRHVLRKPIQDGETIATLVAHRAARAPGPGVLRLRYGGMSPRARQYGLRPSGHWWPSGSSFPPLSTTVQSTTTFAGSPPSKTHTISRCLTISTVNCGSGTPSPGRTVNSSPGFNQKTSPYGSRKRQRTSSPPFRTGSLLTDAAPVPACPPDPLARRPENGAEVPQPPTCRWVDVPTASAVGKGSPKSDVTPIMTGQRRFS